MSNRINHLIGEGEDGGIPNSVRNFLPGSPSLRRTPVHSSVGAMEKKSYSLGRRNGPSEGEDYIENNESDEFQSPTQNPNFRPIPEEAGEGESSNLGGPKPNDPYEEEEDEEINNFHEFRFRLPLRKRSFSPNILHYSEEQNGGEEDEDFSRSPKRHKSIPEDRISSLSDCVLLHILSLLPTESVMATGVLSKRWMHLWESSPNLIFHFPGNKSREFSTSFVNLVNNTLLLYSSPKLKKFHIHSSCPPYINHKSTNASPIGSWLRFAIRHNVEELSLKFRHPKYKNIYLYDSLYDVYVMPEYLLNNSSLTKLSSMNCNYHPKGQVSWGSLRKLTVSHSVLSEDALRKILLGSPVLECLKLKEVVIDTIDVSSESRLERLVVDYTKNDLDEDLYISIPNVKSLEILGYWNVKKFLLLNASSLVNARIEFLSTNDHGNTEQVAEFMHMVKDLLKRINHAKELTLGSMCIQVLSLLVYIKRPFRLENCNFKSLTLNMRGIRYFELPGITSLLNNSPMLEKLVIYFDKVNFQGTLPVLRNGKFEECFLSSPEDIRSSCLLRHLKTIELAGLVEKCSFDGPADALVRFLFQNACVLEKMVVYRAQDGYINPIYRNSPLWYKWSRRLLTMQKASPHALVILPDRCMQ